MTGTLTTGLIIGNILLGRFNSMTPQRSFRVGELEKDFEELLKKIDRAKIHVKYPYKENVYSDFALTWSFAALDEKEELVVLRSSLRKDTMLQYFYRGLPPHMSAIFDRFYNEENTRVPQLQIYI